MVELHWSVKMCMAQSHYHHVYHSGAVYLLFSSTRINCVFRHRPLPALKNCAVANRVSLVEVMDQSGLGIDADLDDEWAGGGQTQLELVGH